MNTQDSPAVLGPVQPPVMQRLYQPWVVQRKTTKTKNIGIYNRTGELMASLDVHQCASEATQTRRMREARLMAVGPDLLDALEAVMKEVEGGGLDDAKDFGWAAAVGLARLAMARAVGDACRDAAEAESGA